MSNPIQAPVYEVHAPGLYMHIIGGIGTQVTLSHSNNA